ncbi:MAG: hypothetical protein ACFB20_13390 [Opitutales bacterium]
MKLGVLSLAALCLTLSPSAMTSPEGDIIRTSTLTAQPLPVGDGALELGVGLRAAFVEEAPLPAPAAATATPAEAPSEFFGTALMDLPEPVAFGFIALGLLAGSVAFRHVRRV